MNEKISDKVKPGVITGQDVQEIFNIAKSNASLLSMGRLNCIKINRKSY